MGTSSKFGGGVNTNPLLPSWLDGDSGSSQPKDTTRPTDSIGDGGNIEKSQPTIPPNPPVIPSASFRGPRSSFTRYLKSQNNQGKLKNAIKSYVRKTAGGSKTAGTRMKSDRMAAGNFVQFLLDARDRGLVNAAVQRDPSLKDKSTEEIYACLIDVICEPGGDLDDSYARDAYSECVAEILEMGIDDLDHPSDETISTLMEKFISRSIFIRIVNAIGNRLISLPSSIKEVTDLETQIKDHIRGAVKDSWTKISTTLTSDKVKQCIDDVYTETFDILQDVKGK